MLFGYLISEDRIHAKWQMFLTTYCLILTCCILIIRITKNNINQDNSIGKRKKLPCKQSWQLRLLYIHRYQCVLSNFRDFLLKSSNTNKFKTNSRAYNLLHMAFYGPSYVWLQPIILRSFYCLSSVFFVSISKPCNNNIGEVFTMLKSRIVCLRFIGIYIYIYIYGSI